MSNVGPMRRTRKASKLTTDNNAARVKDLEPQIALSFFEGATDNVPIPIEGTWHELVDVLRKEVSETTCPGSCKDDKPTRDHNKKRLPMFAPARFRGKRRARDEVVSVTLGVLDLDELTQEQYRVLPSLLKGTRAVLYTSPSDDASSGVRKARVIVAIDRELLPDECGRFRRALAAALDVEPDRATLGDPSRGFFVGRFEKDPEREFHEFDGETVPVGEVLARCPELVERTPLADAPQGDEPLLSDGKHQQVADALEPACVEGQRHALAKAFGGWARQRGYGRGDVASIVDLLEFEDPDARLEAALECYDAEKPNGFNALLDLGLSQEALDALPNPRWDAETGQTGDKTMVYVDGNEDLTNNRVLSVLSRSSEIFSRNLKLVQLVAENAVGGVERAPYEGHVIRDIPKSVLRHKISELVRFEQITAKGTRSVQVPDFCVSFVYDRGEWTGVRPLVGLLETPAIRPDGSVIQGRGYDPATGFFLAQGAPAVNVPDAPTQSDAEASLRALREIFADFAYESSADAEVPIAAILTLLARPAIEGAVPAFVFDAPTPGSGKTLQADAIGTLVYGRTPAKKTWPGAEEERDKVLAAYAMKGAACICFDNIDSPFGGQALNSCLTARDTVELRVLGRTEAPTLKWRTVVLGSGNNVEIPAECARRVLRATINPKCEDPSARPATDFLHYPLLPWVTQGRVRLLEAALTILRAHAVAGFPQHSPEAIGSFEEWSAVVRDAIVFAGGADLAGLLRAGVQSDPKKAALATIWNAWAALDVQRIGMTSAEFLSKARGVMVGGGAQCPRAEVREALDELGIDLTDTKAFGQLLNKNKKRVFGGLELTPGTTLAGSRRWVIGPPHEG